MNNLHVVSAFKIDKNTNGERAHQPVSVQHIKVHMVHVTLKKGALDNFRLNPKFFFKTVEIFIPLEEYTFVETACLILLATST